MKRPYANGTQDDVKLFFGTEVEHTLAYLQKTMFVVGYVSTTQEILQLVKTAESKNCTHIYLGANQSFDQCSESWRWFVNQMLNNFNGMVTLDFDVKYL